MAKKKKMRYFRHPKNLEDLKYQYWDLANQYHPVKGGSGEIMKVVNKEYDILFNRLLFTRKVNSNGKIYISQEATCESEQNFKKVINEFMELEIIAMRLIDCFIWATGDTKPYRETLKQLKRFCKNLSRYSKLDGYIKKSYRDYTLEKFRRMYG